MGMRLHEIHPSLVHAPLVLLPTAAVLDLAAAARKDTRLSELGGRFWQAGVVSGLVAGVAGMAASQEVDTVAPTKRTIFRHGIGNLGLMSVALGLATWRSRHPASVFTGVLGLAAAGATFYAASLGGEVVYGYGAAVRSLTSTAASPPIRSAQALPTFLRDVAAGARWLLGGAWRRLVHGEEVRPVERRVEPSFPERLPTPAPGPEAPPPAPI